MGNSHYNVNVIFCVAHTIIVHIGNIFGRFARNSEYIANVQEIYIGTTSINDTCIMLNIQPHSMMLPCCGSASCDGKVNLFMRPHTNGIRYHCLLKKSINLSTLKSSLKTYLFKLAFLAY